MSDFFEMAAAMGQAQTTAKHADWLRSRECFVRQAAIALIAGESKSSPPAGAAETAVRYAKALADELGIEE